MKINGKEIGFCMTLGAAIEIAKLCPNNDLTKYDALISSDNFEENARNVQALARIMNEGYIMNERIYGREAERFDAGELEGLPIHVYLEIQTEINAAILRDFTGEIATRETKEAKKLKKDGTAAGD